MGLRPDLPLTTPRLLLRVMVPDDVDAVLAYRGREDVCRYLPFEPHTREQALERITGQMARTELSAEGQGLTLGVVEAASGRLVGDVMLLWHSAEHRSGELGYVMHPDVAGRGYATEACAAVLDLAFGALGLHRVIARVDSRNEASARLAARLGMRREAHLVENEWFKGEWSDELVLAVLDREWAARG